MISQLNQRERLMVLGGAVVVVLVLLYLAVIEPYQNAMARLEGKVASNQRQLTEVQDLRREFLRLQSRQNEMKRRIDANPDFSIFSFVENVAARTGVKDNLIAVRPQPPVTLDQLREESVEIRLEKIALADLVQLLRTFETADAVLQVKALRVRTRFEDRSLLDVTMTISAYGRA